MVLPHCCTIWSSAGVLAGLFWLQKGKNNTVLGAQQTIGLLFFADERKMLLKVPTSRSHPVSDAGTCWS